MLKLAVVFKRPTGDMLAGPVGTSIRVVQSARNLVPCCCAKHNIVESGGTFIQYQNVQADTC
jgi:hypothetical protein